MRWAAGPHLSDCAGLAHQLKGTAKPVGIGGVGDLCGGFDRPAGLRLGGVAEVGLAGAYQRNEDADGRDDQDHCPSAALCIHTAHMVYGAVDAVLGVLPLLCAGAADPLWAAFSREPRRVWSS